MAIVRDIGHFLLRVEDMGKALAFYRDLLGFRVLGKENPEWTEIEVEGGRLALYRARTVVPLALGPSGRDTPLNLHVENFEEAASFLESRGVRVYRDGPQSGVVWDPFGNAIGLHDHRG